MMKILQITTVFLLAILFFSCSNDDDINPEDVADEFRVSTLISGTLETNYNYNSENMLTSYNSGGSNYNITYNSDGYVTNDGRNSYTYDSQNKIVTALQPSSRYGDINGGFSYNLKGLIARETSAQIGGVRYQRTYEYDENNRVIEAIETYTNATGENYNIIIVEYDNSGNISKTTSKFSSDNGSTFTRTEVVSYEYDNKVNPLYLIYEKSLERNKHHNLIFFSFQHYRVVQRVQTAYLSFIKHSISKNNIKRIVKQVNGDFNYTDIETYDYSYENNLPTNVEHSTTRTSSGTPIPKRYWQWVYEEVN